ncbi:hypothetical protein BKA66DRAFT_489929 [Pyrenochaeta sp. MPI-SDFR-AT-0127]|nr:hypothetical protein BKA66DRAFT_489929 [Pyrenochaeta sp. MPI-SDFR-AT-0127]
MAPQLDTLPPEILFSILTYTEPTCDPQLVSYPLNALAETNKQLNSVVEEYARGLLKKHANFTPPKSSKIFTCRKKWLTEICQFCKKDSKRRATLYPTLTCCRPCDKEHFPKMTMTIAIQDYYLSKLDLFTPNDLHPHLPPLATGTYSVMGGVATMISERDVIARRDHIKALLGSNIEGRNYLRKRIGIHNRIIQHLGIIWSATRAGWKKAPNLTEMDLEKGPKSMKTEENRRAYVKKGLQSEWAAMGMSLVGTSKESAIEVD